MERKTISKTKRNRRENKSEGRFQAMAAILMIAVGVGLLIVGFYAPPHGEIHSSVLVAFGEILTFVGALFGIDYHYRTR